MFEILRRAKRSSSYALGTIETFLYFFKLFYESCDMGEEEVFYLQISDRNTMSSFMKSSSGRYHHPFNTLSNQPYLSFSGLSSPTNKLPALHSPPIKHNKETTDLKAFKEKINMKEEQPPLSCLRLLRNPQPKLFVSLNDLNSIDFPVMSYTINELITFSRMILDSSPERKLLGKSFNLNKLISTLAENYNTTAYHNFTHAFSLLLLLFQSYNRCQQLRGMLTQKEWFFVMIAALAHDLKHPGTNNAFENKKKSPLSIEANGVSTLQKMHLNELWNILRRNSQINFLQGFPSYQSSHIKHVITKMVLSTDFASHFKDLETLRTITGKPQAPEGKNALFVVQQVFHACDIGNPCLDFQNYMNWSCLVTYEFDEIAKKEKELGLEVSSHLKYTNIQGFYRGQVGFCKGLVLPLWQELQKVTPGIHPMINNIHTNVKQLQKRAEDQQHCQQLEYGLS